MRTITSLLAAGLLATSMAAVAHEERRTDNSAAADTSNNNVVRSGTSRGEFNNECAWGHASGQRVKTDCSINMTGSDGRTYCFSSDQAMAAYMREPTVNLARAKENFGRS